MNTQPVAQSAFSALDSLSLEVSMIKDQCDTCLRLAQHEIRQMQLAMRRYADETGRLRMMADAGEWKDADNLLEMARDRVFDLVKVGKGMDELVDSIRKAA